MSADWNIDDYKTDYESDEHWELRRKFMETYKDKFPEDQLVCLAQVFINVEFMGCRYPDETMRLVGELSQDVASEFRKERAGRLKRTFVKASDAAEQKAKGKRLKNTNEGNTFNITAILKATKLNEDSNSDDDDARPSFSGATTRTHNNPRLLNNYWSKLAVNQTVDDNNTIEINAFFDSFHNSTVKQPYHNNINLFLGLKYGKFILIMTGDRSCLLVSARKSNISYFEKEKVSQKGEKICEILLNCKSAGYGKGVSAKIAKKKAFEHALEVVQKECYTIKPKSNTEKINISRNNQTITAQVDISSENAKLDSNNIGYKMMQKLGWSGGGLGVRTKGREEPIDCLTVKNNRRGLGNTSEEIDANYFKKILQNYINSEDIRDLCFDSCFTKDERARLHQIAQSKNLKSTSYGKGIKRFLVISKRSIPPELILKEILIKKNPMYMNKYEVRVPKCKSKEYPEYAEFEPSEEIIFES